MSTLLTSGFERQIDEALAEIVAVQRQARYGDLYDVPTASLQKAATRARAAISRIAGDRSRYGKEAEACCANQNALGLHVLCLQGILEALRVDLANGYLQSVEELIHGELFADFLGMAEHLLSEGYKDPAAVIVGGALEAHLRQLCVKHSISLDVGGRPKKADTMNSELAQVLAYSKVDQKSVTAWLGLRNKAAHGEYAGYTREQVSLFCAGVRDFVTRNPA